MKRITSNNPKQELLKYLVIMMWLVITTSCTEDSELPNQLPEKIANYLESTQAENQPGLSILIKHQGNVIYSGSKGLARVEGSVALDEHTGFRVGSITKPITAVAIMQLVESDKLALNDKLLHFLPDLPESFSEITIAHLLSHQAGLRDYINDNGNLAALNNVTTTQILDLIPGSGLDQLLFAPGTAGKYSNTGYVFLALIIEQVTGLSYPEYLQANIFEPAGMSDSFVISEKQHMGDINEDYALSFGMNLKVLGFNSLLYGGSGVVSSTSDLSLFVSALHKGELISKQSLESMTQSRASLPEMADYGLGWLTGTGIYWHTNKYSGKNDYWHTGGFDGYRTVLSINPDLGLEIIILTNNGDKSQQQMYDIIEITRDYLL
ncbi:MAG: serine hydrolase domain-containing protein [Reichenbachiella sp.]|uniref:serine hydrolase domain-containing protein n=1 Tax=Reichenbachiella sp. TaxID=2184521 RepID=UPI0032677996